MQQTYGIGASLRCPSRTYVLLTRCAVPEGIYLELAIVRVRPLDAHFLVVCVLDYDIACPSLTLLSSAMHSDRSSVQHPSCARITLADGSSWYSVPRIAALGI